MGARHPGRLSITPVPSPSSFSRRKTCYWATGGPSLRRDFFDQTFDDQPGLPPHPAPLPLWSSSRNLELKNGGSTAKWDEIIHIAYGAEIVRARLRFLEVLSSRFGSVFRRLCAMNSFPPSPTRVPRAMMPLSAGPS